MLRLEKFTRAELQKLIEDVQPLVEKNAETNRPLAIVLLEGILLPLRMEELARGFTKGTRQEARRAIRRIFHKYLY